MRRCTRLLNAQPSFGFRYGAQNDQFDPRVVYSDKPWTNPLKATTGLSGVAVEHRWRKKLMALYSHILEDVKMIPEDNFYRQSVENIYREFLRIVSNVGDTDWRIVERKIGLGQVENLLIYAMDERDLVQQYAEWKLWLVPLETIRQMQDEAKSDMYFMFSGPPEPYLSDEEINDMKKIDQQRMAEEQKLVGADLQKLSGRTSRMLLEDKAERVNKREQYKLAVEQYIRETKLDNKFRIAGDGSVTSYPDKGVAVSNVIDEEKVQERSSYDTMPHKKNAALTDILETTYYQTTTGDGTGVGSGHKLPSTMDGDIPARLQIWEAGKEEGYLSATDAQHSAPVSKAARQGRVIPKWVKPEDALQRASEAPPQKKQ
eukprot:TRINITY_DN9420_c0_g1_i1.p1 TRINITY_DN9420_c0_g1~~TRINITY_DN9420_c0_g1_i1.p1  ORF type:complete len:373 (+),score=65.75 TRINITY_DN9420_c0_g1_i1:46-1164(+)